MGRSVVDRSDKLPAPAVGRALTVLETLVASGEGLTLTELARRTEIPLATCASIVHTLELRGYAARRVVGRSHFWRATLALYGLAVRLTRDVDLSTIAQAEMKEAADRLRMPVHIGVLNGASVVYVAKAPAPGIIQFDTYPGKLSPFNLTALGRAVAAHVPDEQLQELLKHLSAGRGPRAAAGGKAGFVALLEQIRRRGWALELEEEEADIACIAAPFFGADGRVAGSVGVTGFVKDLATARQQRAAGEAMMQLAGVISSKLGYDDAADI